jgi:hypothetical protein
VLGKYFWGRCVTQLCFWLSRADEELTPTGWLDAVFGTEMNKLDVLVVQESFSTFWGHSVVDRGDLIERAKQSGFQHAYISPLPPLFSFEYMDAGLAVFSRTNIVQSDWHSFGLQVQTSHWQGRVSTQGAMYTRIQTGVEEHQVLHLFNACCCEEAGLAAATEELCLFIGQKVRKGSDGFSVVCLSLVGNGKATTKPQQVLIQRLEKLRFEHLRSEVTAVAVAGITTKNITQMNFFALGKDSDSEIYHIQTGAPKNASIASCVSKFVDKAASVNVLASSPS